MNDNGTGWLDEVTGPKIEYAYGLAKQMQMEGRQSFADTGFRAAKARDEKMLRVMEKAAEYVIKLAEDQRGRTRRTASNYGDTAEFTEVGLWREAYKLMDEGRPIEHLSWIYGAGAWLCGYYVR